MANGYVYVNGGDGTLYCVNAATGKLNSTVNAAAGRWTDWGLDGQTLFMPSGGAVGEGYLVEPGGVSIAAYASGGAVSPPVTTAAGQSVAYQVDAAHSGAQPNVALTPPLATAWSVDLGGTVSYPLIAQGRVFATVADGAKLPDGTTGSHLFALDQSTGRSVWGPVLLNSPTSASATWPYVMVIVDRRAIWSAVLGRLPHGACCCGR